VLKKSKYGDKFFFYIQRKRHALRGNAVIISAKEGGGGLTTAEAAATLKVSTDTIKRWIKSGYIGSYKIGGRREIPETEVKRILSGKEKK